MSIQLTADGTHTIHSEKYDVTYHSIHGALQETNHVFIEAGLNYIKDIKQKISILEVGFGTGLNVLATLASSRENNIIIDFHTIEAYPIQDDQISKLNYHEHLPNISKEDISLLHKLPWNVVKKISPTFTFTKYQSRLEEFKTSLKFDIIYFDAFAPTAQPELWEPSILQNMFDVLNDQGVLVTYCAKGQFKRDLRSVGFTVEAIPGPPRKREMTRAHKKS